MSNKSIFRALLFPALIAASGVSQAVVVNFYGELDFANTGPFSAGDVFSGSFTIDEAVTTSNGVFTGAVDNFVLEIAGYTLTGENGRLQQFSSANGLTDFVRITLGGVNGSVSGNVGPDVFTSFTADWRGGNLFGDPNIPANNLTTDDFSYRRITLGFNDNVLDTVIEPADSISFGSLTAVPLPASVWLLGSGLLGLLGLARRKTA